MERTCKFYLRAPRQTLTPKKHNQNLERTRSIDSNHNPPESLKPDLPCPAHWEIETGKPSGFPNDKSACYTNCLLLSSSGFNLRLASTFPSPIQGTFKSIHNHVASEKKKEVIDNTELKIWNNFFTFISGCEFWAKIYYIRLDKQWYPSLKEKANLINLASETAMCWWEVGHCLSVLTF